MYIKNFITLLRRYTTSSLLNVVGMSVAFAAIYLIMVQVKYDFSYDKVIPNSENIYRLEIPNWWQEGKYMHTWNRQLPDEICAGIPEIEAGGTIETYAWSGNNYSIKRNHTIDNLKIKTVEAELEGLEVFHFEFIEGGLENFTISSMIISEETAEKFDLKVGDVLAVGRGLESDKTCDIVGVFKNFPKPSNLAICEGWVCMEPQEDSDPSEWSYPYYVRLNEDATPVDIESKLKSQMVEYLRNMGNTEEDIESEIKRFAPRLNPLPAIYFDELSYSPVQGNLSTTYSLIAIAVLILVISFINFINFFFALIPVRIKAINTYKVFGAPTSKLRLNIMFETLGLTLLSILGAMIIVFTFANTPLSEYISASVALKENWQLALTMILFLMIFAAIMSLYPAFYITKFNPSLVLKGSFHATKSGKILRYSLVGIQYVISISLIICSLFISKQHKYMLQHEMGFNEEQLYTIKVPYMVVGSGGDDYTRRDAFTDELKKNPNILEVAYGDFPFVSLTHMGWTRNYKDQMINFAAYPVSWNFLQMMGIGIEEGRDFMPSDEQSENGVIIFNREAVDRFGIEVGSEIQAHLADGDGLTPIIGISENFNSKPLQYEIEPFAFIVFGEYGWRQPNQVYLRVAAGADFKELRKYIKDILDKFSPYIDVEELKFFDDELAKQYELENKLSTLVTMFSFLSIMISIIGVFGLVLFETQYKRREIGIRRIHGASAMGILKMFNKKYLYIVAICSAVAIPISYYIIDRWMQQFVYRTEMSVWVYVVAVLTITIITVATVSLRSWKAANENPSISINN